MTPEQKALETIATGYLTHDPFDYLNHIAILRSIAFEALRQSGADMDKYKDHMNMVRKYKRKDGTIVKSLDYGEEHYKLCLEWLDKEKEPCGS